MATKPKTQTYSVQARMTLEVGREVSATSLADALAQAEAMKLTDFVEILGGHNDSNGPRITGVFEVSSL